MSLPEMHELDLASPQGIALVRAVADRFGARLAAVPTRMDRMFLLRSPWAPGLRFVGALARTPKSAPGVPDGRISFAGGGESVEDAFVSCIGEAVERLSQFERSGDVVAHRLGDAADKLSTSVAYLVGELCRVGGIGTSASADWMLARHPSTAVTTMVPADWIVRRTTDGILRDHASALSTGTAAGANRDAAALRALLELVERDAAALWWLGGRRARTLSAESADLAEAVRIVEALRQTSKDRASWLLDITTDLGIPTIAAVSVDRNGKGFVCGLAARLSSVDAVRAATIEMCQLEIGLLLARAKREQAGGAALTEIDRRHLLRADAIDAETCALLQPMGAPLWHPANEGASPTDASRLARLTDALSAAGIEAFLVDLTREEFGIPVVKAIAPQLQPLPSDLRTKRLLEQIAGTGGCEPWTGGTPLT